MTISTHKTSILIETWIFFEAVV